MTTTPRVGCEAYPSGHALHQMRGRGISRRDLETVIRQGVRRPLGKGELKASLRGLEVVYKQMPCHQWVITVYRR